MGDLQPPPSTAIPAVQDHRGGTMDFTGVWRKWFIDLTDVLNRSGGTAGALSSTRTISTTAPLTGGGDLSLDRVLAITAFSGTGPGAVPTSPGGTTKYLRADGTWEVPGVGSTDHNDLTGIQGGAPTEYYHLTSAQVAAIGTGGGSTTNIYFNPSDGIDGDMGVPGATGNPGATGSTGPTGPMGPTGPVMYLEGETPSDSPMAIPGPIGPTGATGATGVDAPPNMAPGTVFQIFEDFEHLFRTSTDVHKWTSATLGTGSGVSQLQGTGDGIHHGLVKLETGTTTTGNAQLAMQPAPATPYQGAVSLHATDETIMEGLFYLNALPNGTDTYNFRFGLADASTGSTEACRAFISWDGANVVVTISNTIASVTTTDTATITTLVANQWTHIKMVATLSAQSVYIDGVLIVSATRTASSSQMNPHYAIIKTAGTTEVFAVVDLFWLYRLYATPRHANLGYITAVAATDGVDGINGTPGPAIYLAAEQGEEGLSFAGPPGAAGVAGSAGATGPSGPSGSIVYFEPEVASDGMMGPPGSVGPTGATGGTGGTGPQGDPGTPGTPGADGADGPAGPQGPTGPALFLAADSGEDGISLPGPAGPAGTAGSAGSAGSVGPAGAPVFIDADPGEMGMMGPPGPMGMPYTKVFTLAGDQATAANTTPVTLTGLVFDYDINSTYRIWAMGRVAPTAATTGCGFQFDLSSAVTAINVQFFHQLASTGTLSGGHSIADDASVGVSSGMPGTSTYPVTVHGLLVTTTNTGTAQLRFRSETTAVTTCKAGFTLVVEKVA